ncbi:hypothetical protein FRB95_012891 [Tulasnella sp. JGI-2019a]|nr:hypothetical protein FRB95_012891 [Tulasnella sp. JGI-2019a]
MESAKQVLQLLSTALDVAPIPGPFKSAVTAIPDIALQIIEIVAAVQGNVEDAQELAAYIARVTDTTMRPFKTKPAGELERSPDTKKRLEEFQKVLEVIKEDMQTLMSRRLRSRVLGYDSDASKLAAMKQSVDDAINQLQLETVVAVGHDVNIIRQYQRVAFRELEERDRVAAQQRTQQQLFSVQQQDMSSQERRDAAIDLLINLLGTGGSGAVKKPPCLLGTREHVLGMIEKWVSDASSDSKHCYLLLGQAGTGKSAIASSVAKRETESQRLGAVFHFTRDEQARNKSVILVIARQLANWGGGRMLRTNIASAIESFVKEGLDVAQMAPENQFQQLIKEPLETLDNISPSLIIILDALDECDDAYATTLLRLFGDLLGKLTHQVKLFLTSRGEPHLQRCYRSGPLESHLEIHSIGDEESELVEGDISAYFKQRLPGMVGQWVAEPSNWPGDEKRRALVKKTQGLFICATTVAGMLADRNFRDPEKQLEAILSSDNNIRLDEVYAQILSRACPIGSSSNLVTLFQNVLGALVVAHIPVNIHALASLLCPDGSEHEEFACRIRVAVLSYLQAVLIIPDVETSNVAQDAAPIRFIHSSFIDFLTSKSRCEARFLIDVGEQHEQLAMGCLRRMRDLKRNICDLDPSLLNTEVDDLEGRIKANISPGLQYACTQMSAHLFRTPVESLEVRRLVEGFASERLLYWLEGLSLLRRVHDAVGMALVIESWLKAGLDRLPSTPSSFPFTAPFTPQSNNPLGVAVAGEHSSHGISEFPPLGKRAKAKRFFEKLGTLTRPSPPTVTTSSEIFHDLQRFIMEFMDPIVTSTLHIYSSALAFMPSETELYRQYGHLGDGGLRVVRGRAEQWSQNLWTASKHTKAVTCVRVSPDGTVIVTGSEDHTLRLWDAKTGAAIGKVMRGHTGWLRCIAMSPDGTTVVSGSGDDTLRLWDAKTGAPVGQVMKGHTDSVRCVAMSPDGTIIVSGSYDSTLRLWDFRTGAAIGKVMKGHTDSVTCITMCSDGATVVSGSEDHTLCLWNARTGAAFGKVMKGHTDSVTCLAMSPNDTAVVSGSKDHTLCLWDVRTGAAIGKAMKGHTDSVTCVVMSPDGTTIVSGSEDQTLHLWDAKTGAAIGKAMKGHTDAVRCITMSPDSITIISGSYDNTLHLWDAKTGAVVEVMKGHSDSVRCVAISLDGTSIVSGSGDGTLRLWDAKTRATTVEKLVKTHSDLVRCIAMSPNGKAIVSGSKDHTLCLWDAKTGTTIGKVMKGHSDWVTCVAISPDGRTIVSGSDDHTLRLWDFKTGAAIGKVMNSHTNSIRCLVLSPDGTTIVSGSKDHNLCLWDAKTGTAFGKVMKGHTGWVRCVTMSPDGRTIVSGSDDDTLRLWNAKTGAAIGRAMKGHTDLVSSVHVSLDGTTIISGSADYTLRLWDAKSGAVIGKVMEGHTGWIISVTMSQDGSTIFSVDDTGAEAFGWNLSSQTQLCKIKAHQVKPHPETFIPLPNADLDGWIWDLGGKRMFWLPVDLRCPLFVQGHIIVGLHQNVPIFHFFGSME